MRMIFFQKNEKFWGISAVAAQSKQPLLIAESETP
jgi:hypothetical protein